MLDYRTVMIPLVNLDKWMVVLHVKEEEREKKARI
jgi:hypothetical protein